MKVNETTKETTKETMKKTMNVTMKKDESTKMVLSGVERNQSYYTSILKWWCRKERTWRV